MKTETSLEEEQRGNSPLPSHCVRESAEQPERLTASQDKKLETLRKLAEDLDRRLTQQNQSTVRSSDPASGFYPTPYVEQGRPITPGVATGPEMLPPEVRLNTVYHTAQTRREDSSCTREPLTKTELRTKERKVLSYESEDSTDEDVRETRRHRKKMAATNAKVGLTQHSPRRPNSMSKRAIDPVDEKVGSTQHSPPKKSHSSSQDDRGRTSVRKSRDKRRSSASKPRSASAEERKRDNHNRKSLSQARRATTGSEDASTASSSEEEETVATPKHIIKPPKFDGQSSFETFMAQFANCAEHNKWNNAQKLAYLRNSLEKEAAYV